MASSTQRGSRFGRRILWLAAGILIALLAYSATWFYMAHALEQRIATTLQEINGNGVRAFCEEPEAKGYPFRIGVFCRSVFYEDTREGISVRAGALRSAANIYQPFRILAELDGPAAIMVPLFEPLQARWESLRSSARLTKPLPERISLEGRGVEVSMEEGAGARLAAADVLQIHMRQREQDLDVAVTFSNLLLEQHAAANLPSLKGRLQATLTDGVALLERGSIDPRGQSAIIQEFVAGAAGERAELRLSGPVSVDEGGLIDAELSITLEDPMAVAGALAEVFPEARDKITTAATALGGLGGTPIQLRVMKGNAFIGFIPIGRIPPLQLPSSRSFGG